MPFPSGVQTVTLTGHQTLADGNGNPLPVRIRPVPSRVVSTTYDVVVGSAPVVVRPDAAGEWTVELVATDATGFAPTGWTYRVETGVEALYISLPASLGEVDIADLTPAGADEGEYVLVPGPPGPAGPQGPTGPAGATGATGPIGPQGEAGPAGEQGPAGATGPQGAPGDSGPAGPQGEQGEQGPVGPQPPLGAAGAGADVALRSTDPTTTNARTPTAHASSHATAGTDPISPASIGAATTGDVSTLATSVSNLDTFVGDCLTRVQNIEQGSAFLAGGHYTAPVDITSSGMSAVRFVGRRTAAGPPTSGAWTAGDTVLDSTGAWWLCTASGTPGTWASPPTPGNTWLPSDQGLTAWSFDPASCGSAGTALSAGFIYLVALNLRQPATLSRVHAVLGSAGSGLTAGQCLAGLYDSTGARVAVTADMATTWNSAGNKSMAFTAPYDAAAGRYYVAYLFNGTTSPSFACGSTHGAAFTPGNANLAAGGYRFCRSSSGQTALPSSVTLSAFTPDANNVWAAAS